MNQNHGILHFTYPYILILSYMYLKLSINVFPPYSNEAALDKPEPTQIKIASASSIIFLRRKFTK